MTLVSRFQSWESVRWATTNGTLPVGRYEQSKAQRRDAAFSSGTTSLYSSIDKNIRMCELKIFEMTERIHQACGRRIGRRFNHR